jgi:hypothetical protein
MERPMMGPRRAGLFPIVARSQSPDLARRLVGHRLTRAERGALAELAIRYLAEFPALPGACAVMSAGFCALIRQETDIPVVVAAGGLAIGGRAFYRPDLAGDPSGTFDESRLDWDGHAWVVAGDSVLDLSIFRTGYSGLGPPGLLEALLHRFGPGRGAFVAKLQRMQAEGMDYRAQYVLTAAQEAALAVGAVALIDRFGHRRLAPNGEAEGRP